MYSIGIVNIRGRMLYSLILLFLIVSFSALFFIRIYVSVKVGGVIRPYYDKADVRMTVSGVLEKVLVKEGMIIKKGELIGFLRDSVSSISIAKINSDINQRMNFIKDLVRLCADTNNLFIKLYTPYYIQELAKFQNSSLEYQVAIKKAENELQINKVLLYDKVISPKEYFDKDIELKRLNANYHAFRRGQYANWQSELDKYRLELSQLLVSEKQIRVQENNHFVYSPIAGVVQNIQSRYPGTYIAAGETLCTISPETTLIGECSVNTREVGLLKVGQQVRFQIDAFDYNYFGILTGKIISIDNDFTVVDNKPVFKVRCSFDSTQLHLKNGYKGELKKGLSFQARFIVAERTLWQLLFDKIDDWLNPTAPMPQQLTQRHE
jgi:HlyD family secretion protein